MIINSIQLKNIGKIGNIVDIAYKYVETNVTLSVIKDYSASATSSFTGGSIVCLIDRETRFASRSTPMSLT